MIRRSQTDNLFDDGDPMIDADRFNYDVLDTTGNAARHYDPETGRWLNEEPVGYEPGDVNLYRYVGNAPMNATVPFIASADPKT